ncbi:MAG: tetratricopeptide repeat protein [Pedobacter sp.]|nr:MAG: tetratricopeptide repeat protein [Pedobacter sp.]
MKSLFKICLILLPLLYFQPAYTQKQGLEAVDSIKQHLITAKPDTNKVRIMYRIAEGYRFIIPDSAKRYTSDALVLARKLKWQKGIGALLDCLGSIHNDNAEYPKALEYYHAAYKINKAIDHRPNMARNLNNLGSVYQRQAQLVKAQEYNFQALRLAEDNKMNDLTGLLYSNIATVYQDQDNFAKSLEYNYKALKKHQEMKDNNGIADVYHSLAIMHYQKDNLKKAETYYNLSLKMYKAMGNKLKEAVLMSQIALIHDADKDKKLTYMFDAQKIFDQTNPYHNNSLTNIGNIGGTYADIYINKLVGKGPYKNIPLDYKVIAERAEEYLKKAAKYAVEIGDKDNLSYFLDNLAQLQEEQGNYQQALENFKASKGIDDSLYSQESKNKIASLEAQHAFREKEDEYKQQQQISALKMKQLYLYAALAILLISAILIYLLNRSRIGQLRLKNQLIKKEAEERTKELLHLNKLSESELKAIRAQMNPHFIFNVLNSIESYIVENDSKTASRLVQKFASLTRLVLENSTQSMVTAEREWKALKLYADLEMMRFNQQFTCTFELDPSLDLSTIMLPPMLVQPLIENSIHHGMRNSDSADNKIIISLEQTASSIIFTIDDNGIGMDEAGKFKTSSSVKSRSIGLSAIKERIGIINAINEGIPARFDIVKKTAEEGSGTIAKIILPKVFRLP